ncbi:MAG: activase [Spirochaetaceae bacterium 4572_7]|nr:MAG: activase [Spirochaetaceae bacterium 4572_7]
MSNHYWLGLDIGSTTVKAVLVDPETKDILFRDYVRHGAKQRDVARTLLKDINEKHPGIEVVPILCGSGSRSLADELEASYIQEVVANSLAVREFYPKTRVAIELGGQDAKITFFHKDANSGKLVASDMRMNGSCAGGTGAFLDEVATLLKLPVEELNNAATNGKTIYDISGRCGVFAKTDIQPLLNQGVAKSDLALSCFHAVAKQTIGGLAQGLEIHPPVIFEGGPLFFNPKLVDVYAERLGLKGNDIIIPENPEILIAFGATLGIPAMYSDAKPVNLNEFVKHEAFDHLEKVTDGIQKPPFFENEDEYKAFKERYKLPPMPTLDKYKGETLEVYLGIDAGSTTSKFVLINKDEELVYTYYGKNHGEPIVVLKEALLNLKKECNNLDITLKILGAGTTGYGEMLFNSAFNADYHTVETVAHAEAALKYSPEASFILDIGGQDMKAIFLNRGIVTGITLNEACSAGCGSFLENFAESLKIPVIDIATRAFESKTPSSLGSRCTVFMNSSVISEQKNGKTPDDIMAGLCNSVIENVFTKVIRLSNMKVLGENIVVQGGTFRNDAVLRSLEQFTGREVIRAPYPGEMGAIGIALLTKKELSDKNKTKSSFISWEELENFSFAQESGLVCKLCSNNCNRTKVSFSNGKYFITGNRCEKGEILTDVKDSETKEKLKEIKDRDSRSTDLFTLRSKLLFKNYAPNLLCPQKDITIGIPRVLEFWNSYPEDGLGSIPSDTVCFPAKISHGHIKNLINKKVDRIFMPMISRMITENKQAKSAHVCAVVKGYPLVLGISDDPEGKYNIPYDKPIFHWTCEKARVDSIIEYIGETFGISARMVRQAIVEGDRAFSEFNRELTSAGKELLDNLKDDEFAVVLAGRPYHSDELINHKIAGYFTRDGISVLPVDALPGLHETDLSTVRAELTVNFHVRMFAAAKQVVDNPKLEYLQIVSFGCGHDAVISDEITRMLKIGAGKSPLSLKMDESDVSGPLNIRIKSFLETVKSQRKAGIQLKGEEVKPYEVIYTKKHREKLLLVPNVSWAFGQLLTASVGLQGYRVESLPMANRNAIQLGKKFIHNDMCYPAQITIGELLAALDEGKYDPDDVTYIMSKPQCDCRLAHYSMMARQALDDAGYPQIAIASLDPDDKGMSPGFKMNAMFELRSLWGLIMADVLEDLRRKIRPYEINKGETNRVFEEAIHSIASGFGKSIKQAFRNFEQGVDNFIKIPYDRTNRKPRIFVIGEFLLNFHPSSNNNIEGYLEDNGLEVVMPLLFHNIHREYMLEMDQKKHYHVRIPELKHIMNKLSDKLIRSVIKKSEKVGARHPLFEEQTPLKEIADMSQHIIDRTFTSGEGWQIAGEILNHADRGVKSFIILQPFGCLPNHVVARGVIKKLKEERENIQILALDYDPDTSFANIENRLQMIIINTKERLKS